MIKQLQTVQADTYLLLIKTHNFHWNVKGPNFHSLHLLFEGQYNELFLAVDTIAERLKSLEEKALGSPEEFLSVSSIKGSKESDWKKMLKELVEDNKLIVKDLKKLVKEAQGKDDATTDLAIERIQIHEKNIWMLQSHLE